MRPDLDALLCKRYPEIFRDIRSIECGDGWIEILDSMCHQISEAVKAGTMPPVIATQVKEKFGSLRFCYYGGDDETERLADLAEEQSEKVCEMCGKPGTMQTKGFYKVRCGDCAAK